MYTDYTQKDIERFWKKVDKNKSNVFYNGERCWEWIAYLHPDGYGAISWGEKDAKSSHRVAWLITFGEIPSKMEVCHRCDNPSCVNPSHLFLGTHLDNLYDMVSKGRNGCAPGEKNAGHKITQEQVFEIRKRYAPFGIGGESSYKLAKEFGLGQTQIGRIVRGESWK